jgi:hypothetical protein
MMSNRTKRTLVLFKFLSAAAAKAGHILTCATPLLSTAETVFPPLKQGLWEYQRSVKGGPEGMAPESSYRRCTNPSKDFERQSSMLAKAGCTFRFAKADQATVDRTATCKVSDGSTLVNRTWLRANGNGEFSARIESGGMLGNAPSKTVEELKAKRIGDCKMDS